MDETDALLKETLRRAGKGILTKYKLDWNLPGARKRKGRVARVAAPAQGASTSDVITRITNMEFSLSRIEKRLSTLEAKSALAKLTKQVEEIQQKLKLHQHDREDGGAYTVEEGALIFGETALRHHSPCESGGPARRAIIFVTTANFRYTDLQDEPRVPASAIHSIELYAPLTAKFLSGFRPATGHVIGFLAIVTL